MDKKLPLMGHLVLGYPNKEASVNTIETYAQAGVELLELQIPFSDPQADGPTIYQANRDALEAGADLSWCTDVLLDTQRRYPGRVMPMTYANKLLVMEQRGELQQLTEAGIESFICPDMSLDSPIMEAFASYPMSFVPVVAANISNKRLATLITKSTKFVYVQSGFSITGQTFQLNEDVQQLIRQIQVLAPEAKIGIGFGIADAGHISALKGMANYAIVGSALIKAEKEGQLQEKLQELLHA